MISKADCFEELKSYIDILPVIDCHDHTLERIKTEDIMTFLAEGYFGSDLNSASNDREAAIMIDTNLSLEERWPVFESAYTRTRYTGYGIMVRRSINKVFGVDSLTLDTVREMQKKIPDFSDPDVYERFFSDAHIVARIADSNPPVEELVTGTVVPLPGQKWAISLPGYHAIRNRSDIETFEKALNRTVTSLDEYLGLCRGLFEEWKRKGAVCFKDQSAYKRRIDYKNPTRHEAEAVLNRILGNPRYYAEYDPDHNPLSDYLMHSFLRMARDLKLPVQIHTGHMAGIRNDVDKANVKGLRSVFEIHREVQFDIFHANWPYSQDLLFLTKNYPNVAIDLCWTHVIDPIYSRDFLMQAVSAVPHSKIHGFGSDVEGSQPHLAWAHCEMAKENICCALSELVEIEYLNMDEAGELAADWLFHNPNRFYDLGLTYKEYR